MRGFGTAVAAALLVTGAAAGTASATTLTSTGTLTYNCTFPGIPPQPTTLTAQLDVTDPHALQAFTVTPSATHTFPVTLRSLLRAGGYDAIRGSFSGTFGVSNATPASGAITGALPQQPIGPTGTVVFPVTGSPQVFTAGAAGAVGFTMGVSFTEGHELRKASTGAWVAWVSTCTLKITSPAQNTAFAPSVPIT